MQRPPGTGARSHRRPPGPRTPRRGSPAPAPRVAPSPAGGGPTSGPVPGNPAGGVPLLPATPDPYKGSTPRRGTGFLPAGQLPRRLQTLYRMNLLRLRSPIPLRPPPPWEPGFRRGGHRRGWGQASPGAVQKGLCRPPSFRTITAHWGLGGQWPEGLYRVSRSGVPKKPCRLFIWGMGESLWTSLQPTKQGGKTAPPELSASLAHRASQGGPSFPPHLPETPARLIFRSLENPANQVPGVFSLRSLG